MRFCQLYYFKYYLPTVLDKVDNASMYNSVESRSPFLSKSIINFSLDQKTNTWEGVELNNELFADYE